MKKMDIIFKEWLKAFSIALIIVIILYYLIWPVRISGSSMENTLSDGDFVVVSRIATKITEFQYGELIVLHYDNNGETEKIVKRIIGMEGDHIVIKDGIVYRDGEALEENYVKGDTIDELDIHIPKDSFFVLGDYRKISKDSRHIGCIHKENIDAKVIKNI